MEQLGLILSGRWLKSALGTLWLALITTIVLFILMFLGKEVNSTRDDKVLDIKGTIIVFTMIVSWLMFSLTVRCLYLGLTRTMKICHVVEQVPLSLFTQAMWRMSPIPLMIMNK